MNWHAYFIGFLLFLISFVAQGSIVSPYVYDCRKAFLSEDQRGDIYKKQLIAHNLAQDFKKTKEAQDLFEAIKNNESPSKEQLEAAAKSAEKGGLSLLFFPEVLVDSEVVSHLIDSRVSVNDKDEAGYSPLHHASRNAFFESVKILIQAGAEVDSKNLFGETPLYLASLGFPEIGVPRSLSPPKAYRKVVQTLIDEGADILAQESLYQETPFFRALRSRTSLSLDYFFMKAMADRDMKVGNDKAWKSILTAATVYGRAETLRFLLEEGGQKYINEPITNDHFFEIPRKKESNLLLESLSTGINVGNVANLLLDMGTNPSFKNSDGDTAFHLVFPAVDKAMLKTVERLLRDKIWKKLLFVKNKIGQTPIELAIKYSPNYSWSFFQKSAIDLILDKLKANPTKIPKEQMLDLLDAAMHAKNHRVFKALLFYGGQDYTPQELVQTKLEHGRTLLMYAVARIKSSWADHGLYDTFSEQRKIVNTLLETGADPLARSEDGYRMTPFSEMIHSTFELSKIFLPLDAYMIKALKKNKVKITDREVLADILNEAIDKFNFRVLDFLSETHREEIKELLNNPQGDRKPFLHSAVEGSLFQDNNSIRMVKHLLELGADINVRDSSGEYALGKARSQKMLDFLKSRGVKGTDPQPWEITR